MNLIIVESPGKVKKIQEFVGPEFKVMASRGHVRDLPDKELGVDLTDFRLRYAPTEQGRETLARLKEEASKAQAVYLATDPDREGEAIAWHLTEALGLKDPWRVSYTEITAKAVQAAMAAPRRTDMNLVRAQEGRRALDRLVGFLASRPISSAGQANLSAGRVQSPALRLVADREAVIQNFNFTTHFGVELTFESVEDVIKGWKAQWNPKNWLEAGQDYFLDKETAERIAALKLLTVVSFVEGEAREAPPAPFITSSLQQAASTTLKFSPKRTMDLAQELYQGGHITYMRTDSPNLSNEAVAEIRSLASKNDWPVPAKARTWKSKAGAQEAHEAIRPTHFEVGAAGANDDEKALYRLIRLRALASQLEDASYATSKAVLRTEMDGKEVIFEAKGRRLLEPGWRVILAGDPAEAQDEEDSENAPPLPKLRENSQVTAVSGRTLTKKTKPPARFSEASLIKELERLGIGRPSTYAAILEKIQKKGYVELKERSLVPTTLGSRLIQVMAGHFGFLDYKFTSDLETRLDEIAEGRSQYLPVIKDLHGTLEGEIKKFLQTSGLTCPDCGRPLEHRSKKASGDDKGYDFFGCSGFKEGCSASFANEGGRPGARKEKPALSEHKCAECGQPLLHLVKAGEYDYWKCSGGPECSARYLDDGGRPGGRKGAPLSEYKCPKCGKPLARHQGPGKNGKGYDFYGCSGYPKCAAKFWTKDGRPDFEEAKKKDDGKKKGDARKK